MGELPEMTEKVRLPVEIEIRPYLWDHRFEGRPVFPAVEALQILAASVKAHMPEVDVNFMSDASFPRFLHIKPDENRIEAFNEIVKHEDGKVSSCLITIMSSKSGNITRAKEHVIVKYGIRERAVKGLPFDQARSMDCVCFVIPSQRLYSELVPFGSAYHNVLDVIYLSEQGAAMKAAGADHGAPVFPLGSPFPFDAALHGACAWGQRFSGIVAFPVGFKERVIYKPTAAGETYFCRIIPVRTNSDILLFDIWIYELNGTLCEAVSGVQMRDVSNGRMKPPEWVKIK